MPTHTNRLIGEKSPYLLQHAHNPVEWHPWGESAFSKARCENKPIFLSVVYGGRAEETLAAFSVQLVRTGGRKIAPRWASNHR